MSASLQTAPELESEIDRARSDGLVDACLVAEERAGLPRGLLLAIASRETRCRNVAGHDGHGRGVFQIDDRFHGDWLRRHGAAAEGAVPSVADAAEYAAELVAANFAYGRAKGLAGRRLLKFAAAAFDAGPGGAWKAVQLTGDPDSCTANRNYGADVLDRLRLVASWLDTAPLPPERRPLRRGDTGPDVLELKRLLRDWLGENMPGAAPAIPLTRSFGPSLSTAVEIFQRANGLAVDGVAGPETWGALERTPQLH